MNKRLIFIIVCLVLCFFISLSAISAADEIVNETLSQDYAPDLLETDEDFSDSLETDEDFSDTLQVDENSSTNLENSDDGDILADTPGTFTELKGLIDSKSDGETLELQKDYAYSAGDEDLVYGIFFKNNIVIDGKGHTINGSNQARIFGVGATNSAHQPVNGVVLRNINFVNAYNVDVTNKNEAYGAVEFYGNGTIENCNFTNNYAFCAAAIAIGYGTDISVKNCRFINNTGFGQGGGAIRLKTRVNGLNITSSWFENNYGATYGGALHSDSGSGNGHIIVDDCDFVNNRAASGAGGLFFETSGGLLKNSRFENNTSPFGGAIYWNGALGNVSNSNFTNNRAANNGGAIYTSNRAVTVITKSHFENNTADYGGAIYFDNTNGSSFSFCSFYNNTANHDGGASYCTGQFFSITYSNFTKDLAKNNGGSIYLDVGAYVYNCIFDFERADNDGGGIYLYSKVTELPSLPEGVELGVISSNFTNCSAGHDGGAGYVKGNYGVVTKSFLLDCYAGNNGGAGYIEGNYGRLTDSTLKGNKAYNNAGALMWVGTGGNATYVICNNNTAINGNGGGVYLENSTFTQFHYSSFTGNVAGKNGGAIDWHEGATNGSVQYCNFTSNTALRSGGAIYWHGENGAIVGSRFISNKATGAVSDSIGGGDGGAVIWTGQIGYVGRSYFQDNFASRRGGAVYLKDNDNTWFVKNTFIHNIAGTNGGAINWMEGATNGHLINSTFINNIAQRSGGAVYWDGNYGEVLDSNFTSNHATGTAEAEGYRTAGGNGGSINWVGLNGVIENCLFNISTAKNAGGAIYILGNNTRVSKSSFKRYNSIMGGAICVNGSNINVTYDEFEYGESNYGGVIYIIGDYTYVYKSNFTRNHANYDGGIIYIIGNHVNITSSRLEYSYANQSGGSIYINGTYTTINDCNIFRTNASAANGGAIYINGDETDITYSFFRNCFAKNGGAIYIQGRNADVKHSNFTQNGVNPDLSSTADTFGGSIYIAGDGAEIYNSNFTRTSAGNGGAIYITGDNTNISSSLFMYAVAFTNGGAIYVGGEYASITDSIFRYLNATNGGAVYINGNSTYLKANFSYCIVSEGSGGAVYVTGNNNNITQSNFTITNAIRGNGGAIYAGGVNTTVSYIYSNITNAMAGNGGSIYIEGDGAKITKSKFERYNATFDGGGLFVEGDNVNITCSSFEYGEAQLGGAVYINGNNTYADGLNLTHNHARVNGGAVYINGNHTDISNSNIHYSYSVLSGGAVYINGANNTITKSNFTRNNASSGFGGAVYINGANNNITKSSFVFSTSTKGGAIYINGNEAHVIYSNFSQNGMNPKLSKDDEATAGGTIFIAGNNSIVDFDNFEKSNADNGGFVYIAGENARILNSNFKQSFADENGGAIYVLGKNALISNDTFKMSNATNGGAIYVEGADVNITYSNFTINIANSTQQSRGGSIYVGGEDVDIIHCNFSTTISGNGDGGAIYVIGNYCNITDSTFKTSLAIQGIGGTVYIGGNNSQIINVSVDISQSVGSLRGPPSARFEYGGYGGSVYISGHNATIEDSQFTHYGATFKGGAAYIEGDNVKIENSKFEYGQSEYAGAVYINGESTHIHDSNFSYNHASIDGGVIYINGNETHIGGCNLNYSYSNRSGGSIFINGHKTRISESSFHFNNATDAYGGSIYIRGNKTNITQSLFKFSTSTNGGAIYVNGTDTSVSNSVFNQNKVSIATGDGGTVFIEGKNALIYKSNFTQSHAQDGGFIYVKGSNANISQSSFDRSFAYRYGGAIYIGGTDTYISGCNFSRHNATYGGAIYINGSNTQIFTSNFTMCKAVTGSGGVIFIAGNSALIMGCNLTRYNATQDGGAVYVRGDDGNITNSFFEYGEAVHGGAIFIKGERTYVSESNFTHNHASKDGGIIYIEGSNSKINRSKLQYSYSNESGGAIYIKGVNTTVASCNMTHNNATQKVGGSIYIEGKYANITGSIFEYCTSKQGGAIYVKGDNATIEKSNFTRNMALSDDNNTDGGTIYILGEYARISHSIFSQSKAKYGGIVYIKGSNSNISYSKFSRSEAYVNGGAVYVAGINATVYSSSFTYHNATLGGAVYISGMNTNIIDSNFSQGHASNWAGAIYLGPHTYVYNSTFTNNTATWGGAMYNAGGTAIVELSNFTYNQAIRNDSADTRGGAIYWEGGSNQDAIIKCYFGENKAWHNGKSGHGYGGAIYWSVGKIVTSNARIIDSVFYKNYAQRHGGAIDWFRSDDGQIYNCSFIENKAECDGGALYTGDDSSSGKNLTVFNCTFTRNEAGLHGGALSQQFYGSHIINVTFDSNTAVRGGTIFMRNPKANNTEYINCTFINSSTHSGNLADGNGGAAYINPAYVSFINCKFINGTVLLNQNGGAIYFTSNAKYGLVENCNFTNTTGACYGGAIYTEADLISVKNSTFTLNVARYGGAIFINSNNVSIDKVTFDNNWVRYQYMDQLGGAVYISGENNTISNSTFKNNNARFGGAVYIVKSNNNITSSSVYDNLAVLGAGIYIANCENIIISNTNITGNNATTGSGIYVANSSYSLYSVRLLDNQAHAASFTNKTIKIDDDGRYYVTAIFRGNDNLINGIWSENSNAVNFTNVVYWDENGIATTNNISELRNAEAGQNITVTRVKTRALGEVVVTDNEGVLKYYFDDDGDAEFKFTLTHYEDTYYTELSDSVSILATNITVEVADIDFGDNATVNITLKDRDGNNLTSNVTVRINGTVNITVEVINGSGSINNVSGLAAGIYNATAVFKGNDDYLGSVNSTLFKVRSAVNVTINKTSDFTSIGVGSLVNFTIIVANWGPSNATNVTVWDSLPSGLTYVKSGSNATDQGVKTIVGGVEVVTWNIGNLTKNASVLLWVQINATRNGTFGNVAFVNSTEGGQNSSNITNITVKPVVNLTVIKKANLTAHALVGDLVNFTITVTNHGPSNATNVTVVDNLDADFKFVNASGNLQPLNGKLTWVIDKILNGTSKSVWVIVKVMNNGTYTNIALVNSTENITYSQNKTNITVDPKVILNVVKTAVNSTANVGDMVNFTIVVTNNGLSNATGINISDYLPIGMAYQNAGANITEYTISNKTLTNGTVVVIWNIPKIINGTSVKLLILVNLTVNGTFTNIAFANSNENNTNSTNSTNITVNPVVDLAINKTVNKTTVYVNDYVKYTITVVNNGLSNATGVYVVDKLDSRLKLIKVISSQGNYNNVSGRWTIGNITKGLSVNLTLIVQVLTNGTISNFANVTGNENDTNLTNNNVTSDNVTALPKVNLTVVKTGSVVNASVGQLVNFTIVVTNDGSSNATDVNVTDLLPSGMVYVNSGSNLTGVSGVNKTLTNGSRVVVWNIGKIVNGTSVKLWLLVNLTVNGTFTNIAFVNSNENSTNSTNSTNITVYPVVDLAINKTVNKTTVYVNDYVKYTITVLNNGPSNATGVYVVDKLDSRLKLVKVISSQGNYNNVSGRWTIGNITNGLSVNLTLIVQIVSNGTIYNFANVTGNENDTNLTNNNVTSDNVTALPKVNLTVVKTVDIANASVGQLVNFTIVVTNYGPFNATDVNVTDLLPAGMSYVNSGSNLTGVSGVNKTLTNGSKVVVWNIPLINNNSSVKLWLQVNLTINGTFTNVAFVNSNENSTNSTNSTNITVNPVVDLMINKTVNKTDVYVNDYVKYTITVLNNGPSNATGVYVVDKLDSRLKLVKVISSQGTYYNVSGRWTIGNITKGLSVNLTLIVQVLTNGTIANFANVTGNENDTNLTNNNVTSDNVTVSPKVNLTVVKTSNVIDNIFVGDLVKFTITVVNNGPSNATNVKIVDELNKAFKFISANGTYTNNSQIVNWTIPFIANGTNASVWVQVRVLTNGTFTNIALVNSTENSTISQNKTNITVKSQVNLTVVKTTLNSTVNVGDLVNFTIVVTNYGPSNATDVNVTDLLPSGMVYVRSGSNLTGVSGVNKTLTNGSRVVVWNVGKIVNGTSVKLWLLVNLTVNGTFTNVAFANSNENSTNSTNSTNITVNSVVDLAINKTVNKTVVSVNDYVKYTITVVNNGLSNATGVYVIDKLDNRLKLVKVISSQGNYNNVSGRWTIGNITKGLGVNLTLIVQVLTNGTISNFANVTGNENDTNLTNNNVTSDNVTALPKVNLTVVKTVDIANASVGQLVNFTIVVTNYGPSNATDVNVTDLLPAGMVYVDSSSNLTGVSGVNKTLANGSRVVVWSIPLINNNFGVKLWLLVNLTVNGTFTNVAFVNSNENCTNSTNSTNIAVNPVVDLMINKTVNKTDVYVNDYVKYTITVLNNGPSNATGVYVVDKLDNRLKLIESIPSQGTYNNTTGKWMINNITSGKSVNLTLIVQILSNGTISNFANVTGNENDTNLTNNNVTSDNITADPKVNLTVIKTVDITNASVGQLVNFTIIVTNYGPSNATGVNVTDMLPGGMTYQKAGANITEFIVYNRILQNQTHVITWQISKIMNNTSVKLWLLVNLTTNGTFTNIAYVNSNENNTNSSNSINITVKPSVELIISKSVNKTEAYVGDIVEYTIEIFNKGSSNATGVNVYDELNSKLLYINSSASQGRYDASNHIWTINNITSGRNVTLKIIVRIIANGTIPNIAFVNCSQNTTDINASSQNITAKPQVSLTVIKKADVTNASVGDYVNFTITVINNGLSNATNITVVDDLNPAFRYVSSDGRNSSQKVIWTIDKLANGTNVSLWVQVRLVTNGTFSNTATANSTENTTDVSSDDTNITVRPDVNLTVVKTSNVTGHVLVGDLINFTITVTNNGLSNATNVKITDELNKAFELISSYQNRQIVNGSLTWIIPKIANGTNVSVWVEVKVITNGTFTNTACVNSTENSTASNSTNITADPYVNLKVVKTVLNSTANVGQLVNFTIIVTNNGLSNATGVNVTDVLPSGMVYVSSGSNLTGVGGVNKTLTNGSRVVVWSIPLISNNSSVKLWLQVNVTTNGTFTNVAFVNSNENSTNSTNSTDITVNPVVDLMINKTVNKTDVYVNDYVKYIITVLNNGPSNATGVYVIDKLDKRFKLIKVISSQGTYNNETGKWIINNITSGKSVNLTLIVQVLANGTISNFANVTGNENDTNLTNNDVTSDNVTANPKVNLTVVKTVDISNASVGQLVNFTIVVTNYGPSNASDINVTDLLPSGMVYVSSGSNLTGVGGVNKTLTNGSRVVVWSIPLISNNSSVKLWLQVNLTVNGTFTNIAFANSNENSTNSTNSTDITVNPVVDLMINKTVNRTDVYVNDYVKYTITVLNYGPSNATGVYVIDKLDKRLKLISALPSQGNYNNETGKWMINNITCGKSVNLTLIVQVLANGTISNFANVTGNENDTNASNNNYTCDNVTVNELNTPIKLTAENITYGDSETITVELPDKVTGTVNITVGNTTYPDRPINNGIVELIIPNLSGGEYNVSVVYGGDGTYSANSTNTTFKVSPKTPVIKIEVIDIYHGEIEVLNVTVNAPGYVNITVTGVGTITASLDYSEQSTDVLTASGFSEYDGKATWKLINLAVGTYPVSAIYLGNENYTSVDTTSEFKVKMLPSQVNVSADDIYVGEDAVIDVSVTPGATGNVTVVVDGKSYTANLTGGEARIVVSNLKSGLKDVNVTYNGDDVYLTSENSTTFTVKKFKPPIEVVSYDIYVGDDETIVVSLPEDATGTVTITVDGKSYSASVSNGKAVFTGSGLKAGEHDVKASYSGDDKYLPNSAHDSFKVLKIRPPVDVDSYDIYVGDDETITVTLPGDATGTVTITVDGKRYSARVLNGKAVFTGSGLKAGVYDVKASYSGDDKYLPNSAYDSFKVLKIRPPVDVDSYDIYVGDDETITVTLPGDATGTVTISVGGKRYSANVLNGKAVFKVPGLKAGEYDVKASYSGDEKYLPNSASDTFKVLKVKADISVVAPDITVGDDGVITVRLPGDATGTVTVTVQGKRYTSDVVNGKAVFIIPGLKIGKHPIEVSYSGDDKYLPADTSGAINVLPVKEPIKHFAPEGLEKHPTGNPLMVLVIVLILLAGIRFRKIRK